MVVELTNLPVELLANISSHLLTIDYGNLRRTCKGVERALFRFFATEFFTTRQICIFPTSLDSLVQISEHPELKNYVKKVIIGLDKFSFDQTFVAQHGPTSRNGMAQLYLRYREMSQSQSWKVMLATALKRLPIEAIMIRDATSHKKRPREGTRWRSYGVSSFLKDHNPAGVSPDGSPQGENLAAVIFSICAEAKIQLRSFEDITIRSRTGVMSYNTLPVSSFAIPEPLHNSYAVALAHTRKLFISISTSDVSQLLNQLNVEPLIKVWFGFVPNLEHLRLNFVEPQSGAPHFGFDDVREQRCTSAIINGLTRATHNKLKTFELGKCAVDHTSLVELLKVRQSSLEHVNLHRVTMTPNSAWPQIVDQIEQIEHLKTFGATDCRSDEFVGWRVDPTQKLEYHKASYKIWPAKHDIVLVGNSGLIIAEQARSLLVFPATELKDARDPLLPSELYSWVRFLDSAPVNGVHYFSADDRASDLTDEDNENDSEEGDSDEDEDVDMGDEEVSSAEDD